MFSLLSLKFSSFLAIEFHAGNLGSSAGTANLSFAEMGMDSPFPMRSCIQDLQMAYISTVPEDQQEGKP